MATTNPSTRVDEKVVEESLTPVESLPVHDIDPKEERAFVSQLLEELRSVSNR